jgi:demethylphylloquinol methyltransferase
MALEGGDGGPTMKQGPETPIRSLNYDPVAAVYERLAAIYSFGLIRRAKAIQVEHMRPGDRVLYMGAGAGEDAIAAAGRGMAVTAIDISPRMIARMRRRFDRAGVPGRILVGDVMTFEDEAGFDVVCANFFLNIFSPDDMQRVLARAERLLKSDGRLMIADMAPPAGGLALLGALYQGLGRGFFWLLRLTPLHPIQDYAELAARVGLVTEKVHEFGPARLPLYRTLVLRRDGTVR